MTPPPAEDATSTLNLPSSDDQAASPALLDASDTFIHRHIGPRDSDIADMLRALGYSSLEGLIDDTVPPAIRSKDGIHVGKPRSEHELLADLKKIADKNQIFRSMIGMGYYDTITPPAILRNILENPLWYTPYTPYQAEIAQGRLEALLNFQTMVSDLTGLELANASMLDEATAAAEAMAMCHHIAREKKPAFFIANDCHPQTIAVCRTRAESMGINLHVDAATNLDLNRDDYSGILLQYPNTEGAIKDYTALAARVHEAGALVVVATDLLALTLLRPPGEFGADIAIGSSQRFGVPMGFGGPHAAFMATHNPFARKMPGRIVGVSKDAHGNKAYRLAIQTREQHIKRDRATSNICTAQVLLAVMAGMYAVYHGPEGLKTIATRVHAYAATLATGLKQLGHTIEHEQYFDTLVVKPQNLSTQRIHDAARQFGINLRPYDDDRVGISLDETTNRDDLRDLLAIFTPTGAEHSDVDQLLAETDLAFAEPHTRTSDYLTHEVFSQYRSEHELLRYITRLQAKDISLANSMIPLGSCTMKLNGAVEMIPVTWPEFAKLHPFAPVDQTAGYAELFETLEKNLADITGFAAISLQPNAGSQGEYAGLLTIRAYHHFRGDAHRDICLIPTSAHGTNPASAVIAGYQVAPVKCDELGNIDVADLRAKAEQYSDRLGALMITYPSTHGVFEETVTEVCQIIHDHGGQVYMDGANMNAQVGICKPGEIGADVCHLNLHKTFCIPHGGGGPGMGPIGVAEHLAPFLPGHPLDPDCGGKQALGPVAAAPYGSPAILPISWVYIELMGTAGLTKATQVAILNANYMANKLKDDYKILYTGKNGRVAHEFILDCRAFEKQAGITVEDIAKRLIDFGFHAPTMSWPVPGTLMIEPTESESREELDRLCDALIEIRREIQLIADRKLDREDNPMHNAPHTAAHVTADEWTHPYSRKLAAYPTPWLEQHKYWAPVARIDNAFGDRHLVCTCPPMEAYG